jgi:streptogramin lyase
VYVTFRSAQVLTITRFAGDGSRCASRPNCGDGPDAKSAQLTVPEGVARDAAGNLYIADTGDNEIRKVAPDGTISRIAGNGQPCTTPSSCGDGGRATDAELDGPTGVAVGSDGTVYIADYFDDEIREVATDGTITTLAGDGRPCVHVANCGDGGPAAQAELDGPTGVAVGSDGSVYIADRFDNEIRNVAPDHTIKTVAGNGTACMTYPNCGDTGLAVNAQLDGPSGVAVDSAGNFYIADSFDNEVRQVFGGRIFRLAGDGTRCTQAANCGDGGPATHAQLNNPTGVAVDPSGNVYVADQGDNAVREIVAQTDFITRTAGNGGACTTAPTCGDGGPGPDAQLASPFGVALDPAGNIYIADTSDNEVRKLG